MPKKPRSPRVDRKWIRNESDRAAIRAGCWFDEAAAARVCGFFQFLRHSKGRYAGRPFTLEAWQVDFLSRLFGWKNADGTRRFREAYLEIPKKNGKSTLLSGICLFGLFEEPGAEVYTGAVDREQAKIVFGEASRMARSSPDLARRLKIVNSRIVFAANNAKFEAMSSDAPSKDGVNASLCVLDELHRFKNDALYEVMEYAGSARDQPLRIAITTAGTNRHSLCYRLHQQAVRIEEGATEDLSFLGVIYAADPAKDDLDDPKVWRKANPGLGSIISEKTFEAEYRKAKRLPRTLNNFLRLRLNVWTEQTERWLPMARWDAGSEDPEQADLAGQPCFGGLDLSSVTDLTAFSLAFADGDRVRFRTFYFVPEETADIRSEMDKVPYRKWGEDGHLVLTPGNATDHDFILDFICGVEADDDREASPGLADQYEIRGVGMDPWNAQHMANKLMERGLPVQFIRQGFGSLSGPSKALERLLLAGRLSHDGNPVDRWCIGNVAIETDAAENIKPSKKKSTERIDGVVAMVMALGLAMGPEAATPGFVAL